MEKKGLTLTVVMLAESANYTEGIGNISVLKKMSRGDKRQYTYISRQALRYNIVEQAQWNSTPVALSKSVVQFAPDAKIDEYPEIDLFGYMKTTGKDDSGNNGAASTRSAVARLSNAIALEPYQSDMDYLTNMGMARRLKDANNGIAQSEVHRSYYSYTISIDLDRVGIDGEIEIPNSEKAARVQALLETIQYLYRDIKGRRENLAPIFAIGGVYDRKNPYFENRIKVEDNKIDTAPLLEIINAGEDTINNTVSGIAAGMFQNDQEVKEKLNCAGVSEVFDELKAKVGKYYG